MKTPWFEVDREGLAKIAERRGKSFVATELIQNSWDANKATRVDVTLEPVEGRRAAIRVRVVDDSPDGYVDLRHAWTVFAESTKKTDVQKRGRFNLGEKLVLALCSEAEIVTTTGGVRFDDAGRHVLRRKRDAGSEFTGILRMTREELADVEKTIASLLVPRGIVTTYNGKVLLPRTPLKLGRDHLWTEIADEEGVLRRQLGWAQVEIHQVLDNEVPSIYELGIPVCPTRDSYHVNVLQKVPLNMERDNVTPSYLEDLRSFVLTEMRDHIDATQAASTWATNALESYRTAPEVMKTVIAKRFGEKAVIYDPSDPEANKKAASEGYTVVHGGSLSGPAWERVKAHSVLLPAGRVTPVGSLPWQNVPPIEPTTDGQRYLLTWYAKASEKLLGVRCAVSLIEGDARNDAAWERSQTKPILSLNVTKLGLDFFEHGVTEEAIALGLHEFAHQNGGSDHTASVYHEELCKLGAKLALIGVDFVRASDWAPPKEPKATKAVRS